MELPRDEAGLRKFLGLPPQSAWIDYADDGGYHDEKNKETYLALRQKYKKLIILAIIAVAIALGGGILFGVLL